MNVLMRLFDFDSGELHINDTDIRRYDPADLHSRTTALFQNFSKYNNASVRENTGLGQVSSMMNDEAVKTALQTAGASKLVAKMPAGLETRLESGSDSSYFVANKLKEDRFRGRNSMYEETGQPARAALSGGEVRVVQLLPFPVLIGYFFVVATYRDFSRVHEGRIVGSVDHRRDSRSRSTSRNRFLPQAPFPRPGKDRDLHHPSLKHGSLRG